MGWTFEEMVAYASRGTWVRPGDVLGSGTCGNGGCLAELWGRNGRQDPPPLQPGDVVTLTVEGIGSLTNTIVAGVAPVRSPCPAPPRAALERTPSMPDIHVSDELLARLTTVAENDYSAPLSRRH